MIFFLNYCQRSNRNAASSPCKPSGEEPVGCSTCTTGPTISKVGIHILMSLFKIRETDAGPIDFHWFHEFFFDLFYFYNCSLWRPRRRKNRLARLQTPSQNLGQTSRVQTGQLWRSFCQGRFPVQFTKYRLIFWKVREHPCIT